MDPPLFTVIVPTYGRRALLAEAVSSVLAQTVSDFECLVVDDAGPLPPLLPVDPRLRLVRRPANGGPAAARNTGLDLARGRYLAFLDDDDTYEPDRLALAVEGVRRAPVVVCGDRAAADGRRGERALEGDVRHCILDSTTPQLGRTSVLRSVAPRFDERFRCAEDSEWWLRLAGAATVTTVDGVGFHYRSHDGPRHRLGAAERAQGNLLLLTVHSAYCGSHPRAAAFRWGRVGALSRQAGDLDLARAALCRSIRAHPSTRSAWRLAGTLLRPSTASLRLVEAFP